MCFMRWDEMGIFIVMYLKISLNVSSSPLGAYLEVDQAIIKYTNTLVGCPSKLIVWLDGIINNM